METRAQDRSVARLGAWAAVAFGVNALAFALTHRPHPPLVAYAAAFDVAVTVPALYYLLVVRGGGRRAATLVPLTLVAMARALYVAPGGAWLRPWVGAVAEIAVLAAIVARVRRAGHGGEGDAGGDVVARVRRVAVEVLGVPALAAALATEVAVVYYAFAVRARPHVPEGARPFTVHRDSGVAGWLGLLAGVSLVEALALHLMLAPSCPVAAWVATGASVYGAVWLVAVARSFALRPILVSATALEIRSGLVARVRVPRAQVARVEALRGDPPAGAWKTTPLSAPNVLVTFAAPVEGEGLYGRRRVVGQVAVAVDDAAGFVEAMRAEEQRATG